VNQTQVNDAEIKEFIRENSSLFWYIKEDAKENISMDLLVETILNYGNEKSVKKLFQLVGIKKAAEIFYKQISGKRINYPPRTVHFFNLYFKKNA
jgi:ABC-type nitrate/sulfonate/bicarbonate transport system ATPase subunit